MTRDQRRSRRREIRSKATAKPGHEAWVAVNYVPTIQAPPLPVIKGVSR